MIVIGADTHKGAHALAAVDEGTGRVRGSRQIKADDAGHLAAVRWARELDRERVWAIEDCRHVSGRLEQALIAAGERVVRVPPRMMGATRRGEREPGKSDQIDALAVARAVVKDGVDRFPAAYLDERAMEIRLLSDHRQDLVAERTRAQNRLRWHLVALCPELERSLKRGSLEQTRVLEKIDRRLRRIPACARVRVAREQVAQIRTLTRQVKTLEGDLLVLVTAQCPELLAEMGCGTLTAVALIGRPPTRSGPDRRELRPPSRSRANPIILRPTQPTPTRPRRRPPTQPSPTHHRNHTRQPRPSHQDLPRAQTGRRENQESRAALPQTPPRQTLPPPTRAPRHNTNLRTPNPRPSRPPRPPARRRPHDQRRSSNDLHHLTNHRK